MYSYRDWLVDFIIDSTRVKTNTPAKNIYMSEHRDYLCNLSGSGCTGPFNFHKYCYSVAWFASFSKRTGELIENEARNRS